MQNKSLYERITSGDISAAATHDGEYHADDIFSSALLLLVSDNNLPISRIKESMISDTYDTDTSSVLIYGIGDGKYGSNQKNATMKPCNIVKYSSFGLLWRDLGKDYIKHKLQVLEESSINHIFNSVDAVAKKIDIEYSYEPYNYGIMDSISLYIYERFTAGVSFSDTVDFAKEYLQVKVINAMNSCGLEK